ncbi:MAG: ABC transporter ATP-binding protein [Deltaproteobacteria bacterium]|nr:ABC transporter ATP-binding protein [Deltaproteobacteria bacterium]
MADAGTRAWAAMDAGAAERRPLATLARILAFARPYWTALVAVALFTLLFSAGRYARAYLVKPLLDGVLMPVAEASAPPEQEPRGDWLESALAWAVPDLPVAPETGSNAGTPEDARATAAPATSSRADVRGAFRRILIVALWIVLITPAALFGRAYLSELVLGRIHLDLQRRLATKLLALPLARHQGERTGDLLSRVQNDAQGARESLKLIFQEFALSIAMIGVGLATLLYISWPLTAVALLVAPAIMVVLTVFGRRIRTTARDRQAQLGEVTQRLVGILSGIKVIKAFGAEGVESAAFGREAGKLYRHDMRVVRNRVVSLSLVEAMNSVAGIAILAIGAVLVLEGRFGLTAGDVAFFATALATTYRPIKNAAKGWSKLMEHLVSSDRFLAVLDAAEEPADAAGACPLTGVSHSIEFDDVHVTWRDGSGRERHALRGVSLRVEPGEIVAIVGPTGAGKTSLIDLLLRFHDPTRGAVRIDGHDLRQLQRRSLQERIAVVTQDPFLFDTSIAENIRYGRPDASDAELLAAARAAHVDEFAEQLPAGYETMVGEFGVRLSGGQRQRITIARALVAEPAILIFDEATSALDAKTEHTVQEAIEAMRGERTIFLVAHRLSTVRRADRVVMLADGCVVEQGRHAELMARSGAYAELFALQTDTGAGPQPG